jgi:hypothetical protein
MKDYISMCYAFEGGTQRADSGLMLGFELQAKNFKSAEQKALDMFGATGYESATWIGTSRLKYNKGRDDFELADKKLQDMLIGVDEWIVDAGKELKNINPAPPVSVPALPVPAPKQSTARGKYKQYKSYTVTQHPITMDIVRAARSYSHIEYDINDRKEVFK